MRCIPCNTVIHAVEDILPLRIRAHVLLHNHPPALAQGAAHPPQILDQLRVRQMAQTPLVPDQVISHAGRRGPGFEGLRVDGANAVGGAERRERGGGENVLGEFGDRLDYVGRSAERGEQAEGYAADAGGPAWELGYMCVAIIGLIGQD
jgi:hypothetical protein